MFQQRQASTHSLTATPIMSEPNDNSITYPPPFFISRNETKPLHVSIKMLQTETTEVCQLSQKNPEHIRPAWIYKSEDSSIQQIDCEVDTGVGCNVNWLQSSKRTLQSRMTISQSTNSKDKSIWWKCRTCNRVNHYIPSCE